jgi:hypothetical protein
LRDFTDAAGRSWRASIREEAGTDYKGRFYLVLARRDGGGEDALPLEDVRWNSERTARRTIETMSEVELRRRLRSALGRAGAPRFWEAVLSTLVRAPTGNLDPLAGRDPVGLDARVRRQ